MSPKILASLRGVLALALAVSAARSFAIGENWWASIGAVLAVINAAGCAWSYEEAKRRPLSVTREKFESAFDAIFGKKPAPITPKRLQAAIEHGAGGDMVRPVEGRTAPAKGACEHTMTIARPDDDITLMECLSCGEKVRWMRFYDE